jgi:hypothetical protein
MLKHPQIKYSVITNDVSDYKFIGKKVISTQKLNALHSKEQLKHFVARLHNG